MFPIIAWLSAVGYVAANGWFGAGDLFAFAFWSLLLSSLVYPALRLFDRLSGTWPAWSAYLVAMPLGLLAAVISTVVIAAILGGWIGAFSFPVFHCWLGGTLASCATCVLVRRPKTWLAASFVVAGSFVSTIGLFKIIYAQPADLVIHIVPSATSEQIEMVWSEVLGIPHPSGRGHSFLPGIRSVSRADGEGEARLRVTFARGTSVQRRAEVVTRILASPLVSRTSDLPAIARGEVHANLSIEK